MKKALKVAFSWLCIVFKCVRIYLAFTLAQQNSSCCYTVIIISALPLANRLKLAYSA